MGGLAAGGADPKTIMIDGMYLSAHRTACSLCAKKGGVVARSAKQKGSREKGAVRRTVSPENGTRSCMPSPIGRSGSRGIGPPDQSLIVEPMPAGQVSDDTGAAALLDSLPQVEWRLTDRGCDADWLRKSSQNKGIRVGIPERKSRKRTVEYGTRRYRRRNRIEIMLGRLKGWRRVAMRYDRCPETYLSAIALAATVMFWL
ncbi:Transposase [Paracoccus nototheniae]